MLVWPQEQLKDPTKLNHALCFDDSVHAQTHTFTVCCNIRFQFILFTRRYQLPSQLPHLSVWITKTDTTSHQHLVQAAGSGALLSHAVSPIAAIRNTGAVLYHPESLYTAWPTFVQWQSRLTVLMQKPHAACQTSMAPLVS